MQITLNVNGKEMTFSEEELITVLEKHFNQTTTEQQETNLQKETLKPIRGPEEGVRFEVNPQGIDRSLFEKERKDQRQETTRQRILEAFAKMDKKPAKYGKPFKTLMPAKTWEWKTVGELKKLATKLGDHNADWVEQALEWAQRIQNGETWEAICNEADTANWYRLVVWKNGYARFVGGSRKGSSHRPASDVSSIIYYSGGVGCTVPLVVLY